MDRSYHPGSGKTPRQCGREKTWLHNPTWVIDGRTDPDGHNRKSSDAEAIERAIDELAKLFANEATLKDAALKVKNGRSFTRDELGRFRKWVSDDMRCVKIYLVWIAFGRTLSELVAEFHLSCKGAASRKRAKGKQLVEARDRIKNEPQW